MSDLTDRIAAEHSQETVNGRYGCACGESSPDRYFDIYEDLTHWHRAHVAAVTEAAVREQVSRDIKAWITEQAADGVLRTDAWSDGVSYGAYAAADVAHGGAA